MHERGLNELGSRFWRFSTWVSGTLVSRATVSTTMTIVRSFGIIRAVAVIQPASAVAVIAVTVAIIRFMGRINTCSSHNQQGVFLSQKFLLPLFGENFKFFHNVGI